MPRCFSCMRMVEKENLEVCPYCNEKLSFTSNNEDDVPSGSAVKRRYFIGRSLGQGGNAITYIALDQYYNRVCAIKECYVRGVCARSKENQSVQPISEKDRPNFERALTEFKNEIDLLKKISGSDFCVSYFDDFDANGTHYLVMEYANLTLNKHLRGGKLTPEEAQSLMCELLLAVQKMHAFPYPYNRKTTVLLHRDISTDNICLYEQPGKKKKEYTVKLIDFGSAQPMALQEDNQKLKVSKKPGYTSPEQWSSEYQDTRSDLYSCGVVLYKMLCGHPPAEKDEYRLRHPLNILQAEPGVPHWMARVVEKATQPNPKDRFQTAEEFLQALGYKGGGRSEGARLRLPRGLIIGGAVGAAAVVALLLLLGSGGKDASPQSAPTAAESAVSPVSAEVVDLRIDDGKEVHAKAERFTIIAELRGLEEQMSVYLAIYRGGEICAVRSMESAASPDPALSRRVHTLNTASESLTAGDYTAYVRINGTDDRMHPLYFSLADQAAYSASPLLTGTPALTPTPTPYATSAPETADGPVLLLTDACYAESTELEPGQSTVIHVAVSGPGGVQRLQYRSTGSVSVEASGQNELTVTANAVGSGMVMLADMQGSYWTESFEVRRATQVTGIEPDSVQLTVGTAQQVTLLLREGAEPPAYTDVENGEGLQISQQGSLLYLTASQEMDKTVSIRFGEDTLSLHVQAAAPFAVTGLSQSEARLTRGKEQTIRVETRGEGEIKEMTVLEKPEALRVELAGDTLRLSTDGLAAGTLRVAFGDAAFTVQVSTVNEILRWTLDSNGETAVSGSIANVTADGQDLSHVVLSVETLDGTLDGIAVKGDFSAAEETAGGYILRWQDTTRGNVILSDGAGHAQPIHVVCAEPSAAAPQSLTLEGTVRGGSFAWDDALGVFRTLENAQVGLPAQDKGISVTDVRWDDQMKTFRICWDAAGEEGPWLISVTHRDAQGAAQAAWPVDQLSKAVNPAEGYAISNSKLVPGETVTLTVTLLKEAEPDQYELTDIAASIQAEVPASAAGSAAVKASADIPDIKNTVLYTLMEVFMGRGMSWQERRAYLQATPPFSAGVAFSGGVPAELRVLITPPSGQYAYIDSVTSDSGLLKGDTINLTPIVYEACTYTGYVEDGEYSMALYDWQSMQLIDTLRFTVTETVQ